MTIEELCEKYWPEGCAHFECDMGNYVFILAPYTDGPVEFCRFVIDRETLPGIISVIACVAAMHWQNREREWGDKGDAIFFNLGEQIPPEKVEAMNKAFDEANKALVAQKAWSELAKGV